MTIPVTRIGPSSDQPLMGLSAVWSRRELLYFLVWRDVRIRYSQTVLGIVWAVLQPIVLMGLFTLFFGRIARISSDGLPYSLFVLAALVPWQLFSSAVANATESVVSNERIVTKVYFPRILLPFASVLAALVDFVIALALLGLMLIANGFTPTSDVIYLPLFVALAVLTALGAGVWLAALNTEFRDFRYVTPFLLQTWLFATPIVFSSSAVPGGLRPYLALNPMTGVVEGFRWTILGGTIPSAATLFISTLVALAIFFAGLFWFRRIEDRIADII